MPVHELVRFAETLDDSWRSPVADAAAECWGLRSPVFVRSSASHVFVAASGSGEGRLVLRMRPDTPDAVSALERGARAAAAWCRAGAPFVDAVPSSAGRLVERVDGYAVTALRVAEGDQLDESPVDGPAAYGWGAALATLHGSLDAGAFAAELPTTEGLVGGLPPELADAAEAVREELTVLPRDPAVRGVLHGDPEADNVIRTAGGLVLVDPDEVRVGWFVSDVAFGLRDWQDGAGRIDWTGEVPAAFLDGYRSVRPLTDDELGTVPLLVRAAALEDLAALQPHLARPPDDGWPGWAVALDSRVRARAEELRAVALAP